MGMFADVGKVIAFIGFFIMCIPFISGITGLFIGSSTGFLAGFSLQASFPYFLTGGILTIIGLLAIVLDRE